MSWVIRKKGSELGRIGWRDLERKAEKMGIGILMIPEWCWPGGSRDAFVLSGLRRLEAQSRGAGLASGQGPPPGAPSRDLSSVCTCSETALASLL